MSPRTPVSAPGPVEISARPGQAASDAPAGPPVVAVIGGGQLARMMSEEASALGIHMRALVEAADGSTGQVTVDAPVGRADDAAAVRALVEGVVGGRDAGAGAGQESIRQGAGAAAPGSGTRASALTFEHEHQDEALLRELVDQGVSVQPSPQALRLARDKIAMRRAMDEAGLPQPAWAEATGDADAIRGAVRSFAAEHGWPIVLKTPRGGYDGHGVLLVRDAGELESGRAAEWVDAVACGAATGAGGSLGGGAVASLLIEEAVPFTRELAVLLARSPSGQVECWPVVQTVQAGGMCAEVLAPAPGLDESAAREAERIGRAVAERFEVTGVLAVELFAVEAGSGAGASGVPGEPAASDPGGQGTRLYVNELAMRPHNSGHWTQDGAVTSQFAQHLRAVADLPLGSAAPTAPVTVMVNVLGGEREPAPDALARAMAADNQARIHMYGKAWRPRRKIGHVNLTGPAGSEPVLRERARAVAAILAGEA